MVAVVAVAVLAAPEVVEEPDAEPADTWLQATAGTAVLVELEAVAVVVVVVVDAPEADTAVLAVEYTQVVVPTVV